MVSHFRVASRHGESCQEAREEPKKRGEMVTGDMNTQTSTFYHGRVWPPFTFYHVCGVEGRASRWERSVTVRGGEGRRQEPLDACRGDCQWPTTRTPAPRAGKKSRERRAHRALGAHPLVACNDWTSPDVWVPSAEARLAIARAARLPHRAARLPRRFRARSRTNAGSHRIGSASWANYSHSVSQLTLHDSDKIPSLRLD